MHPFAYDCFRQIHRHRDNAELRTETMSAFYHLASVSASWLWRQAQTWKVMSIPNSANTERHILLQAYREAFKINGKSNRSKGVEHRKHTPSYCKRTKLITHEVTSAVLGSPLGKVKVHFHPHEFPQLHLASCFFTSPYFHLCVTSLGFEMSAFCEALCHWAGVRLGTWQHTQSGSHTLSKSR